MNTAMSPGPTDEAFTTAVLREIEGRPDSVANKGI